MKQMSDEVYGIVGFCCLLVLLEVVVLIAVGLIEVVGWMI